jgi:diguanylate cyclase (GGDEF)-like protein/PAS domain S-box-containing protein/putative nucleotidyltransferase with HDIG domain
MRLRTQIFLRAASLLVLLVAGTCTTVLVLALNRQGAEAWTAGTLRAVLEVGIAMLVLGLALSAWVARATTREVDRATNALRESETRHRTMVENIRCGISLIDTQHRIITINPAQAAMFGRDPAEFVGQSCYRMFEKREAVCDGCPGARALATGKSAEADHEGVRDDGTRFAVWIQAFPILGVDGRATSFIEVVVDMTERKRAQEALEQANLRLEELATTDELTGMWNRRHLVETLKAEIERVNRQDTNLALVMFDVDQLKPINDACGHALGDLILCEVAKALREAARTTDVVARYAGDEFVVLMPGTMVEEAVSAAERLRQAVEHRRVSDDCRGVRVSVSAGVAALRTGQTDTPDTLLRAADEALLAAKNAGRNCVRAWGREADQATDEMSVNREAVERLRSRVVALSHRSREMFVRGVRGLVHEQETRDPYAKHHSENVAHYAACIAQTMGLDAQQVGAIRRAGLLHDIGKIGVPDEILWKPSGLTAAERKLMQQHVVVGVRILDQLRFLEREVPLVRHHHERYDGRGYPDGISGETIPLGARILGVADAFDAICADRPYLEARTVAQALQIIVEDSGRQFDPKVVDVLLRWVASVSRDCDKVGGITVEDLCENRPAEIEAAEEVTAS